MRFPCCLQESHASLQQQLAERQQQLGAAKAEAGKLAPQRAALERRQARLGQEAAGLERQLLERLGEQIFAEKGAQQTLREIEAARAVVQEHEAAAEQLRASLEQLGADTEATEAGNARLGATLAGLEAALAGKAAGVAVLEAEVKAGHADVEAKTRQLDALNRRYQRLLDSSRDVETGGWVNGGGVLVGCGNADGAFGSIDRSCLTLSGLRFRPPGRHAPPLPAGPLEATIANLQREIAAKTGAGRELQRRWIGVQGQLVALQAENAELAESVGAMRAQQAVMQQKRARLNSQ
jgi:chromosome segregation ATPase